MSADPPEVEPGDTEVDQDEPQEAISCAVVPRVDTRAIVLPHRRRGAYVYHTAKAMVCKPFAGQ